VIPGKLPSPPMGNASPLQIWPTTLQHRLSSLPLLLTGCKTQRPFGRLYISSAGGDEDGGSPLLARVDAGAWISRLVGGDVNSLLGKRGPGPGNGMRSIQPEAA